MKKFVVRFWKKSGNPRWVRLLQKIYPDVFRRCYGSRQEILEELIDKMKEEKGVTQDTELTAEDLKGTRKSVQS